MVGVWIMWGQMPEPGTVPSRYDFDTQAELDAFLKGVDESSGWMEYEVKEDDTPYPDPDAPDDIEECEFVQQNPHEWFCTTHQVLCIGSQQEPVWCAIGDQEREAKEGLSE